MTTLAYDGKHLVSDTQITEGYGFVPCYTEKIFQLNDGSFFSSTGKLSDGILAKEYFDDISGVKYDRTIKQHFIDDKSFRAIHVQPDGSFFYMLDDLIPIKGHAPYAHGTGTEIAFTCMRLGFDAVKAIEEAIKYDIYTGGTPQIIKIKEV